MHYDMSSSHRSCRYYRLDHCWVKAQGPSPSPLIRRILSCDRACSLSVNFVKRVKTEFADNSGLHDIAANLEWAIPKMHIHGHTENCQYKFHLAFTDGVGRTDGESVERGWVEMKLVGVISKDASPATRGDIINCEHNWSNWVRSIHLREHLHSALNRIFIWKAASILSRQAQEARREGDIAEEEYRTCSQFLPPELISQWRADYPTSEATVDTAGELVSRFRSIRGRGLSRITWLLDMG